MMLMLMVTPFSEDQSLLERFRLVGGACRTTQALKDLARFHPQAVEEFEVGASKDVAR
jgi:hypothetical protein